MANRVSELLGKVSIPETLIADYEHILRAHLASPSERWRYAASALGKKMVAAAMGPEMLVAIHAEALRRCQVGTSVLAGEILLEAMLAFALEYYHLAAFRLQDQERLASDARVLEGLNRDLLALHQEMSERHEELQQSHAALDKVSAQKSDLLATVTHEIRTPLTAILGYGEFLEEGTYGELNLEQAEVLHQMIQGGKDLLELVNRILDLSRIEAGKLYLDRHPVPLAEALEQAANQVRPQAQRNRLELLVHPLPADLPPVLADSVRLVEILTNLLGNAVKFTPAGGRIELDAQAAGDWAEVRVSDTGPGIEPEQQRLLFEKYAQTPEGARRYGSSGLGLALCRELVNLHGGRIWVESVPDKGATFVFTLPLWRGGEEPGQKTIPLPK